MLAEAPWEGRHTAGYAEFDGRMWIVGGDVQQGHYQSDVWSSADGVDWDCAVPAPLPPLPSAGPPPRVEWGCAGHHPALPCPAVAII